MHAAYYERNKTIAIRPGAAVRPGPGQVRLNVAYCGICGTDVHIYHGKMDTRVANPQIMGHEASGIVAEVGTNVMQWSPGDRVVVRPLDPCNSCPACRAGHVHICQTLKFIGIDAAGAFQSSWTVPAHTLHRVPDALGLDLAALIEPLAVACHDVRIGSVRAGEFAVVLGGGPIGVLIALVARAQGAQVVISEMNPHRIRFAEKLGFAVVNPSSTDLAAYVNEKTGGTGADIVFEVTASAAGAAVMTELPRTRGRIVVVGIFSDAPKVNLFRFFWRELRLFGARVYEPEDFDKAIALAAGGTLPLPGLITATYPLAEILSAFSRIETDANAMKILINLKEE